MNAEDKTRLRSDYRNRKNEEKRVLHTHCIYRNMRRAKKPRLIGQARWMKKREREREGRRDTGIKYSTSPLHAVDIITWSNISLRIWQRVPAYSGSRSRAQLHASFPLSLFLSLRIRVPLCRLLSIWYGRLPARVHCRRPARDVTEPPVFSVCATNHPAIRYDDARFCDSVSQTNLPRLVFVFGLREMDARNMYAYIYVSLSRVGYV